MKIKYFILINFIFFSFCVYSQTELEFLWNKAIQNNVNLKSELVSLDYVKNIYKNKKSLYSYSLKTLVESSFNDNNEYLLWYANSARSSIVLSKKNPFGNSILGKLSYSINRNTLDFFKPMSVDNIGYSHIPEISITVEQSLFPSYLSNRKDDLEVLILKNNILETESSFYNSQLLLIQNITNYYIKERNVIRQLEKFKKVLNFYDTKINDSYELYKNSKIAISEIWELENTKWEYYEDYIELLNTKEDIELSLKKLCGEKEIIVNIDSEFPNKKIRIIKNNPLRQKLLIEKENLNIKNVLEKQNSAPVFSVGASFSESTDSKKYFDVNFINDKNQFNWNFSLSLSFDDFFSPIKNVKEKLYKDNLNLYEDKLKDFELEIENQYKNYSELIKTYKNEINKITEIRTNRIKIYNDYKILYKNEKCSKIELEEVYLNVVEADCIYNNLCDSLWFYEWMRTQCL